jgi:hypothetical protein
MFPLMQSGWAAHVAARARAAVVPLAISLTVTALVAGGAPAWAQPAAAGQAAPARTGALRVTVLDPSSAIIIGATVRATAPDGTVVETVTDDKGEANLVVPQGELVLDVTSAGFNPQVIDKVRVRGGTTRREVTLTIAAMLEEVTVARDPNVSASDPRGDAFSTALTKEQIDQLPDDEDELEQALLAMAGPGATMRINGLRSGGMPPKSQIRDIRFRRNMYAADTHESGFFMIDITTQPGTRGFRSSVNATYRDDQLNARNALATKKVDEQARRGQFSIDGPLWKGKTSFELNVDAMNQYDSRTILVATPGGYQQDTISRPTDRANVRLGVDHALSKTHTLRANFERRSTDNDMLGVGEFDLATRAYARTMDNTQLYFRERGPIAKNMLNEFRLRIQWQDTDTVPASLDRAIRVNGAFNSGGAQTQGRRKSTEIEFGHDIDVNRGKHNMRFGSLLERNSYDSSDIRNAQGTFTFSSLADYEAGRPTTYTQRIGDPQVGYNYWTAGLYAQDDVRVRKDLTLSLGIRQEWQSYVDSTINLAPRVGIAWSPLKSGNVSVTGGAGIFYDWLDANTYEETLQVDGVRVQDIIVRNPSYPDVSNGGVLQVLPSGRYEIADGVDMPRLWQASLGVERRMGAMGRLNVSYRYREGTDELRGRNMNAPVAGVRPDPSLGNVIQVQSIGRSQAHQVVVGINAAHPKQLFFVAGNYTLSFAKDDGESAFALPANNLAPDEWSVSRNDVRHRLGGFFNLRLPKGLRLGSNVRIESAAPYTITTGFDDNGDSVFNDRPAGVARNSERGSAVVDMSLRLSWQKGFGKKANAVPAVPGAPGGPGGGPGGGGPVVMRGGDGPGGGGFGGRGGGGGGGGGARDSLVSVEVFANASNVLNRANYSGYSGVLTSPLFGQPTTAQSPRRIELGMRVSF